MSKLFIIGNGFDLAHNVNSTFLDFKTYLKKNNEDVSDKLSDLYDEETLWSNFEEALGDPKYTTIEFLYKCFESDITDSFLQNLKLSLKKWVLSLKINNARSENFFKDSFTSEDYFLTFNYTNLLEEIYEINENNVIHIHGNAGMAVFDLDDIIFGHNKNINANDCDLVKRTFKNTEKILSQNKQKINEFLSQTDEITVIGFSYNNIDFPYFEYIANYKKIFKWNFYYYSDKDKEAAENYKKKLKLEDEIYKIIKLKI